MADTLNMLVSNKTNPKLIETNNFMIINGTLYQKSNLSSMKKAFSFSSALGSNILHMSRSMHLTDDARIDHRMKRTEIKEDPYIENRSYIILNNQYANDNNSYCYLLSLNETENDCNIINSYPVQDIMFQEIISITDSYIFVSGSPISGETSEILYCFDKNLVLKKTCTSNGEWTAQNGFPYNRGHLVPIYEEENYIYFLTNGFSPRFSNSPPSWTVTSRFAFCRINKSSLDFEFREIRDTAIEFYGSAAGYKDYINDFYKINNKLYFFIWNLDSNPGLSGIFKFKIDTTLSFSQMLTSEYYDDGNRNIFYTNQSYRQLGYFIKDEYLFYYIADETNSSGNILNYQGLHRFKIEGEFDLIYEKRINPSSSTRIISVLFNKDYSIVIIGYYQGFDILIYEEETHDYVKVGKSFTGIKNVGLDSLNRLWYETTSGEIHTENFDDPQDVVVEFEKPYYSYLSGELETYVTFKARSATGVVPTGRYILRITTGNAYFKDSGTNELVINYESMSQDDIHYPLMITGSKRIVCNVSFEKVW